MINAVIERSVNRIHISIAGHAEYNPGNDIVCSGVSAIAYAFLGLLKTDIDTTPGCLKIKNTVESGNVDCSITDICFSHINRVNTALDLLYIGLKQIEMEYPDHVQVVFSKNWEADFKP